MEALTDLKEKVFNVLEDYMSLHEFEKWLYESKPLQDLIGEDVVLEVFAFYYKQDNAKYRFKKVIFPYFDEDEFLLWKVKSNLRDLMADKGNRNRILDDFFYLGYDGYYFLQPIGYYMFQIEGADRFGDTLQDVLAALRKDAESLLLEIQKQELDKPGFRLADYRSATRLWNATPVLTKIWWNFWK